MKRFGLIMLALLPAALILCTTPSFAQGSVAPDGQLGIQAGTQGLGLQYALSPSLQIGGILGLQQGDVTIKSITLTPYAKFLLEGDVNPFFMVGATISSADNGVSSSTTTSLGAAFGLEYYINPSIGIFGQAQFFELGLDPSATIFGLFNGHAGVEWFFD
ncbi:MAG: hypothetical protein KDD67_14435 [Ignavibacteriae bacterium]|nr:hypothetical protein [Ignavibacteriota bacterium]